MQKDEAVSKVIDPVILNVRLSSRRRLVSGSRRIVYQIQKYLPAGRLEFGMTLSASNLTFETASPYHLPGYLPNFQLQVKNA